MTGGRVVTRSEESSVRVDALALPPGRAWPRESVLKLATAVVRPVMSRRARKLVETSPAPRLHLGCASTVLPGWVNIDLFGRLPADVSLDVTKPLPFGDASIEVVFTEHMVEHLTYEEALRLARECARVLQPGGVVRVVVPDFGRYVRSYLGDDDVIDTMQSGRLTRLVGLASTVYGSSHRSIWDAETLIAVLECAGLSARVSSFGDSRIRPCPDSPARAIESLYVEAVKA
jgi:predicted SAM-dependent methyltransferase